MDQLTLSDAFEHLQKTQSSPEITVSIVQEKEDVNTDYEDYYKSLIENSGDLSKQEKYELSEMVKNVVSINQEYKSGNWTSDKESMYHLQTQMKLDVIAEKLMPSSLKEKFNKATGEYTERKLQETVNVSLETYQIIYNRDKNKSGPFDRIADRMKDAIQEIKEGSHITQREQEQYKALYSQIDVKNGPSFQQGYEKVMEGYENIQKQQLSGHWNSSSQSRTDEIVELLREDWNAFVNSTSSFHEYPVFSKKSFILDSRI
ncbi:hypothetical protein [Thalassobacillus sp. CUG 92003]|uniref:hypothetical protein n=1 Tax=Thalassobacillus sp. CUG 92003 TaxID=2736641 RepID=UPI0015E6CE6C|nr:hypothetical protein [Thalassobacillus sp. CUG 92003]